MLRGTDLARAALAAAPAHAFLAGAAGAVVGDMAGDAPVAD